MNELLNSGIGMPHYSPYNNPEDPNDHRTPEEKIVDGCLVQIIAVGMAVLVLFFITMATSCSSHRDVCGVTQEMADTLAMEIEQQEHAVRSDTSLTQTDITTATVFNSSAVESTASDETETETISEHVTVTTDSLGRTTTTTNRTTNRTIQRKNTQQISTADMLEQYSHEAALNIYLSRLDSLYSASLYATAQHQERNDSTHDVKEVSKAHPVSYLSVFGWLCIVVLLIALLSKAAQWWRGK